MAMEYTEEQLNKLDKTSLVQLFLMQQAQLKDIDHKLQLLLEQVAVMNSHRLGRTSEKLEMADQIWFMEIDGTIVYFNEAEAVVESAVENTDEAAASKPHSVKTAGKRTADLTGLPVIPVEHKMSNDELTVEFGENGWYQLEDEIYSRYHFTPMKSRLRSTTLEYTSPGRTITLKRLIILHIFCGTALYHRHCLQASGMPSMLMQLRSTVRNRILTIWVSPLTGRTWHAGQYSVMKDIFPYCMTICTGKCINTISYRRMKPRYV